MRNPRLTRIFTITRDNYNEVLPQLNLGSDVMSDIHNAINAGHKVTTHEHNINFHGWKGADYVIVDPNNGTGAYLISGGLDGGAIFWSVIIGVGVLALFSGIGLGFAMLLGTFTIFGTLFLLTTIAAAFTLIFAGITALSRDEGFICNTYKSFYASTASGVLGLLLAWFGGLAATATGALGIEMTGNLILNNLTNNLLDCPSI